jgi:hypothetical protein
MIVKKALAMHNENKSLTFSECLGATKLEIPKDISALLNANARQLTSAEETRIGECWLNYKIALREAINKLPNLEERIIFQRRLLGDGSPLRNFMMHERLSAWFPNLHLTSQISIAEKEAVQTQKLLAILFFRDYASLLATRVDTQNDSLRLIPQVEDILKDLIVNYFTSGRTKEAFTEHLFGLTTEEQDKFFAEIVDNPDSVLGKLYREARGSIKISKGLFGDVSSTYAQLKSLRESLLSTDNLDSTASNAVVDVNTIAAIVSKASQDSLESVDLEGKNEQKNSSISVIRTWEAADDKNSNIAGNSSSVLGKTREDVVAELRDTVEKRKNAMCVIQ